MAHAEAPTCFASAERADATTLAAERQAFLTNTLATKLLDAIPDLALVLNSQRQILAVNQKVIRTLGLQSVEQVLGQRPGEAVSCIHAAEAPGGCGTGPSCEVCGAVNAILRCLETHETAVEECRLRTSATLEGGALDLEVQAAFLEVNGTALVMMALRDISGEKRRAVLERTFFHDVLNIVSGLRAVAELLSYGEEEAELEEEYRQDLYRMSVQIGDEIIAQRQLLAAERGDLALALENLAVPELLESVGDLYRNHSVARGRELHVSSAADTVIRSDGTLLRRVLGNLVKNALEATAEGEVVTLRAERDGENIRFSVHNPSVMPEPVQKQVFQRSFSTKGGSGRGIGTHSVKLLTEGYLGGSVSFVSQEPEGTLFLITLPVNNVGPETAAGHGTND